MEKKEKRLLIKKLYAEKGIDIDLSDDIELYVFDEYAKRVANLSDINESLTLAPTSKIFERLVELYPDNYVCVAKICDEVLDRSGALLGKVRKASN